ncbi:plastid division protein PDV1-like [Primulina eburnea]|uniref:plastid division protein PDV1-like n=1 Tax=Primulina eburnea TaxID=1245227 RepID=UPI003C6C2451
MKWKMEVDEIEAVLEKIWDLHDRFSDAIHAVSRAQFLNSVKNPRKIDEFCLNRRKTSTGDSDEKMGPGFVFVKESRGDEGDFAVHEAKSLYAIRTALENLEDQLEFFHMVQTQQRAERDAAVARLEQSRIVLAMRLAEHQGKKYNVIKEAQDLVGDVRNAGQFVTPEHLYVSTQYPSGESFIKQKGTKRNPLVNFFISAFTIVSKSLKLDNTAGIFGNAALLAVSMLAFVQMNQHRSAFDTETRKVCHERGASNDRLTELDVYLARG